MSSSECFPSLETPFCQVKAVCRQKWNGGPKVQTLRDEKGELENSFNGEPDQN